MWITIGIILANIMIVIGIIMITGAIWESMTKMHDILRTIRRKLLEIQELIGRKDN